MTKNRLIHFKSPSGRDFTEECGCAKRYNVWSVSEVGLLSFYVYKRNSTWGNVSPDFCNRYYEASDKDSDFDRYDLASEVYDHDFDCEKINAYRAVFLHKEDCQRYCDWANKNKKE